MTDRVDKLTRKEAADSIALNNKLCRTTRNNHKRVSSKAARQALQRRKDEE